MAGITGVYTHVPSEGSLDASIVILGESPWINEVESGRPFAGASGHLMGRHWAVVNGDMPISNGFVNMDSVQFHHDPTKLRRRQMRIMNLFPYRPPTREIGSVPTDRLIKAIEDVHARIARLTDPYVIVPMGNYSTYALTGKGKVKADVRRAFDGYFNGKTSEAEKKAGITQLRGSIYPYIDANGRTIKVIPMIHPAGVLQMAKWEKRSIADWRRVLHESQFREIRDPGRQHIIDPTAQQVDEFCHAVYQGGANVKMAVDIESWGNQLSCCGFALEPYRSLTIPLIGKDSYWLPWVRWLCESEAQKILCNGTFDWYWLDAYEIQLRNYWWDVQSMHHALDPAESHSLDFLASIYCPHYVFWKDEAKEAEEIVKYAKNAEALWTYNGLDCCYTRELQPILEQRLREEGMLEFYFQCYVAMFEPLLRTMRHGIRVDVKAQRKAAKRLRGEMEELHQKLNEFAGCEMFAVEVGTALRVPSPSEWEQLLGVAEYAQLKNNIDLGGVPESKYIDREARKRLLDEQGLTYMISGQNAGKIRYKIAKAKKDFSGDKLIWLFYEKLELKKQYKLRKNKGGKKKSVSLDEDSLRKLMHKFPRAVEPGQIVLQFRGKKKEWDYLKGAYDKDGRVRCQYKMTTRAGRLASAKNPMRRGMNLQNIKR